MMKATLILLLFCSLAHADITGRVVAVIDGDTIKVLGAALSCANGQMSYA